MTHDYHEGLPGYHPDQLLIDGCAECEQRGKDPAGALAHLDARRFPQAWLRAADWMATTPPSGERPAAISDAEAPLLRTLWHMQVHLERQGLPLGALPRHDEYGRVFIEVPAKVAIR